MTKPSMKIIYIGNSRSSKKWIETFVSIGEKLNTWLGLQVNLYNLAVLEPTAWIVLFKGSWYKQWFWSNFAIKLFWSSNYPTDKRLCLKSGKYKSFLRAIVGVNKTVPVLATDLTVSSGRQIVIGEWASYMCVWIKMNYMPCDNQLLCL